MPPLRKPHRVAFLVPELTIEGSDASCANEAALLLWIACIELCQRHPGLAVHDADATPLGSQDGKFLPDHARPGASPSDAFYRPTRRDELVWLELALPKPGAVRLHALARDGSHQTFEAAEPARRNLGDQIHQAIERWLAARGLGALPRRFEAVDAGDLLAAARVFAPALSEHARAHMQIEEQAQAMTAAAAVERSTMGADTPVPGPDSDRVTGSAAPMTLAASRRSARSLATRLTAALKLPALRLIALALREDLGDLILAADPEQPQALFEQFGAGAAHGRDYALLRRIIAAAPGWARPYGELIGGTSLDPGAPGRAPPSALETVAGAGVAAMCRPEQLDVIETAADRLDDSGRVDDGIRLLERAVADHPGSPAPHIALVNLHRRADRRGAWLAQAERSQALHGCPLDPSLPRYPDQIQIDLLASEALLHSGRLDDAIGLRADRLRGRDASWPRDARTLAGWRTDPRFVAWCYARDGHLRGDPARAVEGYSRAAPDDAVDAAALLDALVATGRDAEVALAWAQLGLGKQITEPVARLAAARCLLAAGDWRRGVEELWRVELTEPARDAHVAIARAGLLLACAPLDVLEAAIGERLELGAHTLARRMARDVADFMPGAASSAIVLRALGKATPIELDLAWLAGFPAATPSRRAIDALFGEPTGATGDAAVRARDRLINRWLEVVFTDACDDDPAALANAAAYAAAQALGRYLVATTAPPGPLAGGYRVVAGEALALVRRHRGALGDRWARAVLGVLEPLLRRVDRWIGNAWLGAVERSCAIDERSSGDVAGFVRDYPTIAARILGPEETAVLSASVSRLHRERPEGWAAAVAAQASRLASHTGTSGAVELADAVAVQLAARELETDDAIDQLHTACYLSEGISAEPCVHAARVLFAAGRGQAAFTVLCAGLGVADTPWRTAQLRSLAAAWGAAKLDVPLALPDRADRTADPATGLRATPLIAQMLDALRAGDPVRVENLGRFALALDPRNAEAHRNLGVALAQQGRIPEALHHLTRGAPEQATQILAGVLAQSGKLTDALAVLDYASRSYTRAEQWLAFGAIAGAAADGPRTVAAYRLAHQLDPAAFHPGQLDAFAAALAAAGDDATCEAIAKQLLLVAGDDLIWKTSAWSHLACVYISQGKLDEAVQFAQWAVDHNPRPENAGGFAAILARAQAGAPPAGAAPSPPGGLRAPAFQLLDAGAFAAAAALHADPSWRVRRVALTAACHRSASDNHVAVTPRARAAARAVLAETVGLTDRDAVLARDVALAIREQAHFARDPAPRLGAPMTRDAFHRELRARGAIVLDAAAPPPPAVVAERSEDLGGGDPVGFAGGAGGKAPRGIDRVVVPDGQIARISDYVALLRDLAALSPRDALAAFDLDDAAYLDVARAWAAAIAADPALAAAIAARLANP